MKVRNVARTAKAAFETMEWKSRLGAHWTFLSDQGRIVQQDLDIKEYPDLKHDPMIPHTILLDPGLVIYKIYNGLVPGISSMHWHHSSILQPPFLAHLCNIQI
jgi:hypothetical protein